jgi:plastocyanin
MGGLIFLLACVLVVLAAGSARGAVHTIEVMEWTFDLPNVTISPGDTVRWVLLSGAFQVYSLPESPKQWISPVLEPPGSTFDVGFTHYDGPGPFPFTAEPNDGTMYGEIITANTCWASGDINNDGIELTVADLVYLNRLFR